MNKIKVAMITNHLDYTGISSVIINYCMNIDLNTFDIIIIAGSPIAHEYMVKLKSKGIKIIEIRSRGDSKIKYYKDLYETLSNHKFDIVHVHGNSSSMILEMFILFIKNIKVRIAHCHNNNCSNKFFHYSLLPLFNLFCTDRLACSNEAGKWLYKNRNYEIMLNAFDVGKFKFNNTYRQEIRNKLNISDSTFLIGHVGRFNNQKNQEYLLDIITKTNSNIKICFVGNGYKKQQFIDELKIKKIENKVLFLNETIDIHKVYSAFDLFLFPSKYEGFGNVMLEAQINGLSCVASTNVPIETKITKNVVFLSLDNKNTWLQEINKNCNLKRNNINLNNKNIQKYDIKKNVEKLENFYLKCINR